MYTIFDKFRDTFFRAFQRYDLSALDVTPDSNKPIYGVYHVYCDKGWETMVTDQIARLRDSGLLEASAKLYVSCIMLDENDLEKLKKIIDSSKLEIISATTNPRMFEYPALEFIHSKSKEEDCLIYYFHTKGITYQTVSTTDRKFNAFKRNIESWRHLMEYFLFYKWKVAVNSLRQYDTYGCYRLPPPPMAYYLYAGNFWWAKSSYLRTLPQFDRSRMADDRFFAEEWLYRSNPKDFSAFDTMADLYYVNIPECLYASEKLPLWEAIKFVAVYNFRKMRKQYFGHDYKAEYQKKYQVLRSK